MSEWTSVNEKLPPFDEPVLVWDINNIYRTHVDIAYYDPSSSLITGWHCDEYMDRLVTHWQYLPEPPK